MEYLGMTFPRNVGINSIDIENLYRKDYIKNNGFDKNESRGSKIMNRDIIVK
jgi:hypothetical protein